MNTSSLHAVYQRLLTLVLTAFVFLAGIYSIVTPLFEASDELWHYPMVKTLADGNGLPVQDPASPGPWRQEGSQPPLYYAVGALVTFWIDTADMGQVRRLNPHADNGIVTEDGNNNIVVHRTSKEAWPWQGTTLAVHIVRFLSILFSAGTVYFTYKIGEELFPHRRWLALAGAAIVAFTPMFAFISGSINNDNLSVLLATLAVWMAVRIVRQADTDKPTWRWALAMGVVLGLAALSKQSTLGLFGIAGLSMAYAALRKRSWQVFFVEGPAIVGLAAAIAGWWYWRNWRLYGDPTGLNVFLDIVGRRSPPASIAQLWGEREGFMASYWGLFGGVSVPMSGWVYIGLNTLAILSIPGVACVLVLKARREVRSLASWMPTLLTLLWIPAVAVPLATGWTRYTLASQGRLVFAAVSVLSLWFVAGLCAWLPDRWGKLAASLLAVSMAALAFAAPFTWIAPHYHIDFLADGPPAGDPTDFTPPGSSTPAMRLLGFELDTSEARPGGQVRLSLFWESLTAMDRDWSVFIHLRDSAGLMSAQRDLYPGRGLIATTDLTPGQRWIDHYVVPIPETAYSPETLDVHVGLYYLPTEERMVMGDGTDSLVLGQVGLLANTGVGDVPNPISVSFGGEVELIGYSVDRRLARPGDTVTFRLYWRTSHQLARSYTGSVQVLDHEAHKYGQQDNWLLDGELQTAAWQPGKIIQNDWGIALSPDTPPGIYDVQIVVYWADESGSGQRLQRLTSDGRLTDDFLIFTHIRVGQ